MSLAPNNCLPSTDSSGAAVRPPRLTPATLREGLTAMAREYPPALVPEMLRDVDRMVFNVGLLLGDRGQRPASVCDIGGGVCMFSVACAALGMRAVLVDDFNDPWNRVYGDAALAVHRRYGVEVVPSNPLRDGFNFADESFDAITCFDSMEHWHHSPKRVFHEFIRALKPGGLFVLSGPNCVNLRKRITVPLGRGKWTSMAVWYEEPVFRSHVREPDVDDLRYIARDLGLTYVRILGRNWAGYKKSLPLMGLVDALLRCFPPLCSDIYVIGRTS